MTSFQTKVRSALDECSTEGKFVRVASGFREYVSASHAEYKPEKDRYHLYVAYACPWANRCLAFLKMKGLEDVISVSATHATWKKTRPDDGSDVHHGWIFRSPDDEPVVPSCGYGSISCNGCIPDFVNGATTVRDLYDLSNDTTKKYTVPILWDKKTSTIVNNESSEIIKMLNSEFDDFITDEEAKAVNLYPEDLMPAIEDTILWVYSNINTGVYRCGFAKSQPAYDEAVESLYSSLDRAEAILSQQRYLCSHDRITAVDVMLFMTLVRFDEVYVVYFKCNRRRVSDYPALHHYVRELFQIPAIRSTIHMDHIKNHYFTSHPTLNPYAVVPRGPDVLADLALPHNRAALAASCAAAGCAAADSGD